MLHTETVTAETLALTKRLMADTRLNDFLLVGGTALALTIGHRISIDIDLFTGKEFDALAMSKILADEYGADRIVVGANSVNCLIDNIKADLIAHRYPRLEEPQIIDGVRMMGLKDIAAMKLHSIVNSGGARQKDFIDIYFMLERTSLNDMYEAYEQKYYPNVSRAIARLALTYHKYVNLESEIVLLNSNVSWRQTSSRILQAIESPDRIFANRQKINYVPKQRQVIRKGKGRRINRGGN